MTDAQKKLAEAEAMVRDTQADPITRGQLALAQKRTAQALRNTIAIVAIIMAVSVAGIWFIYGSTVSAVPQSAAFVWKDNETCVYRVRYIMSSQRTITIDSEAPSEVCPPNPTLQILRMSRGNASASSLWQ